MSESSASRSTILPFPSSPHCAPTITVAGTAESVPDPAGCPESHVRGLTPDTPQRDGLRHESVTAGTLADCQVCRCFLEMPCLKRTRPGSDPGHGLSGHVPAASRAPLPERRGRLGRDAAAGADHADAVAARARRPAEIVLEPQRALC